MRLFIPLAVTVVGLASANAVAAQDREIDPLLSCGYLCGEDGSPLMTATETPPDVDLVTRIFIGAFSEPCAWALGGGPGMIAPEVYDLRYKPTWAGESEPDRDLKLYRFFCGSGAYNERHIYYIWTADSGVAPVLFPLPTYAADYVEDGEMDSAIDGLVLTGMTARHELVNSTFDPATGTVSEWSCWRGLCDASGRGTWWLDPGSGSFRLVTYDIDPTYDGEVNLFRLVDFSQPTAIDITTPLPFEPPALEDEEMAVE